MTPSRGAVLIEDMYLPYVEDERFIALHANVPASSPIRIYSYHALYLMALQSLNVDGDFIECGVYKGGSASFLAMVMEGSGKRLRLFDTFSGMPECDAARDPLHVKGDFSDVSIDEVRSVVGREQFVSLHPGVIPQSFDALNDVQIAFAHVDVDIYESTRACCEFIYPRLSSGGVMVLDDYGHRSCLGAKQAVDEYFSRQPSVPLPLYTGQAIVMKI